MEALLAKLSKENAAVDQPVQNSIDWKVCSNHVEIVLWRAVSLLCCVEVKESRTVDFVTLWAVSSWIASPPHKSICI